MDKLAQWQQVPPTREAPRFDEPPADTDRSTAAADVRYSAVLQHRSSNHARTCGMPPKLGRYAAKPCRNHTEAG